VKPALFPAGVEAVCACMYVCVCWCVCRFATYMSMLCAVRLSFKMVLRIYACMLNGVCVVRLNICRRGDSVCIGT
jgi:hypothetical protein